MKLKRKDIIGIILVAVLLTAFGLGALNAYVEGEKAELLAQVSDLESNVSRLEDVIADAEATIQAAQEVIESQIEEITALREELGDYAERIDRLNGDDVPAPVSKTVYLTFDDGPSHLTYEILKILDTYGVKATFFVNGRDDAASLGIYKAIHAAGHTIGNHTYSHNYRKVYASADAFMDDIYKLDELLYSVTGEYPTLVRYPGGSSTTYLSAGVRNTIIRRLFSEGYQFYDWNVDSRDSARTWQTPAQIVQNVVGQAKANETSIVLFHDLPSKTNTAHALPTIIEKLSAAGYTFAALDKDTVTYQHCKLLS